MSENSQPKRVLGRCFIVKLRDLLTSDRDKNFTSIKTDSSQPAKHGISGGKCLTDDDYSKDVDRRDQAEMNGHNDCKTGLIKGEWPRGRL